MGRYTDKKSGNENVTKAYNYLVQEKGIKPHLAAGIIGNLQQESYKHLDSTVENEIGAVGIAQWLGPRRRDLENFAKKKGKNYKNFELQLDFLHHELTNTGNSWGSKAQQQFFNAKNTEEAAALFVKNFERSGEKPGEKGYDRRINYAKSVYLQYNDPNTYSKDDKGQVVVLNPEVVTEKDVEESPAIKREFYNSVFNIPNERPKAAEPAPVKEAKQEIDNTKKEVEFKNKIGDILSKMGNAPREQASTPRQFNFEGSDIRVQENEFYQSFENGGKTDPKDPRNKKTVSESTLVSRQRIKLPQPGKVKLEEFGSIEELLNDKPKKEETAVDRILTNANFTKKELDDFELPNMQTAGINLDRASNKRSFRVGDRGTDVKNIQAFLINQGMMDSTSKRGKSNVDGVYGNITKRAIERFQKENGLTVDGILGKKTLEAIQNKRDKKVEDERLMNPKVQDGTSVRKSIYKEGFPVVKKEEERKLSLYRKGLNAIPLMARAFIEDTFGGESPITQDNLNDGELQALKDAVKYSLKNKTDRITYDTWRAVGAGGDDVRTDDVNFLNPAVSLQKTLGQANIVQEENGDLYVVDRYNFNDAGDTKNRNKNKFTNDKGLLPLSEATSFSNGIYRAARNFKTEFGSAEGGMKSRIFVGNVKDLTL